MPAVYGETKLVLGKAPEAQRAHQGDNRSSDFAESSLRQDEDPPREEDLGAESNYGSSNVRP
jgi:hypothetical protein